MKTNKRLHKLDPRRLIEHTTGYNLLMKRDNKDKPSKNLKKGFETSKSADMNNCEDCI